MKKILAVAFVAALAVVMTGCQKEHGDVAGLLEEAELYHEAESWNQTLRCFAEAKNAGYKLSQKDLTMVEDAYTNRLATCKMIRKRVERDISIGKSPMYDLEKLDEEMHQLHAWYQEIRFNK